MNINSQHQLIIHPPQSNEQTNQFSLVNSLHQLDFNSFLDPPPSIDHHPIDPRLEPHHHFLTTTLSPFNHTLDHTSSEFLSKLSSHSLPIEPELVTKRAKLNFENPSFQFADSPLENQINWKDLPIDDQIAALLGDSIATQFDINFNHGNPQDITLLTPSATASIQPSEITRDDDQKNKTPPSTIPVTLLDPQKPQDQTCQSDQLSAILADHYHSLPSNSMLEPSIDPALNPRLSITSFDFSLLSSREQVLHSECANKQPRQNSSKSISPSASPVFSNDCICPSLNLSQVDVHGAGAGGGAAAVLEAAATQQQLKNPRTLTVATQQQNKNPSNYTLRPKKRIRKTPKSTDHHNVSDNNEFDLTPTSYNPDQFRNRIHWTKQEEQLLLDEVELHWHHYDCMAQIMKRHGPEGTISKTFADRTGISLKDKAVNIASKWYRDGTELNPITRRAFARFRPKQLRGTPKKELPGMIELSNFIDSTNPSPSSRLILKDRIHPD